MRLRKLYKVTFVLAYNEFEHAIYLQQEGNILSEIKLNAEAKVKSYLLTVYEEDEIKEISCNPREFIKVLTDEDIKRIWR